MRKALTALALTATAFVAPLATTGTAYAAETQASAASPLAEIVAVDLSVINIPGGCTLTYVGMVLGTPIGRVVSTPPGQVVIDYWAARDYAYDQRDNTLWYIGCI